MILTNDWMLPILETYKVTFSQPRWCNPFCGSWNLILIFPCWQLHDTWLKACQVFQISSLLSACERNRPLKYCNWKPVTRNLYLRYREVQCYQSHFIKMKASHQKCQLISISEWYFSGIKFAIHFRRQFICLRQIFWSLNLSYVKRLALKNDS